MWKSPHSSIESHMRTASGFLLTILAAGSSIALAQSVPAAIYTDPPADAAHPATMTVLHIPSHGLIINGLVYSPPGAGPHPTIVICHGLPGNEKNLDLAQALRRAGWNAVTFNYRGSWGSPGNFRFAQTLEDAVAVLAYLRDPANATRLGIDTRRIAMAGHSMGGWVTALTAANDHALRAIARWLQWPTTWNRWPASLPKAWPTKHEPMPKPSAWKTPQPA
jgi:acetyl esterase/lipase